MEYSEPLETPKSRRGGGLWSRAPRREDSKSLQFVKAAGGDELEQKLAAISSSTVEIPSQEPARERPLAHQATAVDVAVCGSPSTSASAVNTRLQALGRELHMAEDELRLRELELQQAREALQDNIGQRRLSLAKRRQELEVGLRSRQVRVNALVKAFEQRSLAKDLRQDFPSCKGESTAAVQWQTRCASLSEELRQRSSRVAGLRAREKELEAVLRRKFLEDAPWSKFHAVAVALQALNSHIVAGSLLQKAASLPQEHRQNRIRSTSQPPPHRGSPIPPVRAVRTPPPRAPARASASPPSWAAVTTPPAATKLLELWDGDAHMPPAVGSRRQSFSKVRVQLEQTPIMTVPPSSHLHNAEFGIVEAGRYNEDFSIVSGKITDSSTIAKIPERITPSQNWNPEEKPSFSTEMAWHEARAWLREADTMQIAPAVGVSLSKELLHAAPVVATEVDVSTQMPSSERWQWPVEGSFPTDDPAYVEDFTELVYAGQLPTPDFLATGLAPAPVPEVVPPAYAGDYEVAPKQAYDGSWEPLTEASQIVAPGGPAAMLAEATIPAMLPGSWQAVSPPELVTVSRPLAAMASPSTPKLLSEPGSSVIPVGIPLATPLATGPRRTATLPAASASLRRDVEHLQTSGLHLATGTLPLNMG